MRKDRRSYDQLRLVEIHPDFIRNADGSVLIKLGETRVICTASVENTVPSFLKGTGKGWVTSEYSMIPRSTPTRTPRESTRGKPSGRTHEIQRLIGRCLRSVVQLEELGERTVWIDCDVIEADGGTRTASITGGFVALALALKRLAINREGRGGLPLRDFMAATSVGLVNGELLLDLDYEEDSQAQVDMNVVQTGSGRFVELQGTAEGEPFSREVSNQLIDLASLGIQQLIEVQRRVLHWRPEATAIA
ncbi:MAG TPA: ribonuclease PH [Terriglobia bacterium]|nr:ribonuclease PH [Terriglobia bacterium]